MRIVEQSLRVSERTNIVRMDYPSNTLFQVFVKGRLQPRSTYSIEAENVDFGFDVLVPGDIVQMFYLLP